MAITENCTIFAIDPHKGPLSKLLVEHQLGVHGDLACLIWPAVVLLPVLVVQWWMGDGVLVPWVVRVSSKDGAIVKNVDIEPKGFPAGLGTNGDSLCVCLLVHEMELMSWTQLLVLELLVASDHFISRQQRLSYGMVKYFIWYMAHESPLPRGVNPVLQEHAEKVLLV